MPTGVYARPPALDRLLAKVDQDGLLGCWSWTGGTGSGGYGLFYLNGHFTSAHRAAYLLLVGPIPEGLDIDHLCRVRVCVNPAHLEPVTRSVNLLRAMPFRKDTTTAVCAAGHPRTPDTTYDRTDRRGRNCKPCAVEATRRWRRRHAA